MTLVLLVEPGADGGETADRKESSIERDFIFPFGRGVGETESGADMGDMGEFLFERDFLFSGDFVEDCFPFSWIGKLAVVRKDFLPRSLIYYNNICNS